MTEGEKPVSKLLRVREHLAQLPGVGSAVLNKTYVRKDMAPEGLPHPEYGGLAMESAEIVVTHENATHQVIYEVDSQGNITGASIGKVRVRETARERLAATPSPTNAIDALALLFTIDEAALEEGLVTTEQVQNTWRGIIEDLSNADPE